MFNFFGCDDLVCFLYTLFTLEFRLLFEISRDDTQLGFAAGPTVELKRNYLM